MRLLLLGIELPNVTARFKAWITPILANIVGPPDVATRIGASIAVCHSAVNFQSSLEQHADNLRMKKQDEAWLIVKRLANP